MTGTASPSHVQVQVSCTGLGEYMLRVMATPENSTIFLAIGTMQVAAVVSFPTMALYSHCKPGSKCCRRSSQHQLENTLSKIQARFNLGVCCWGGLVRRLLLGKFACPRSLSQSPGGLATLKLNIFMKIRYQSTLTPRIIHLCSQLRSADRKDIRFQYYFISLCVSHGHGANIKCVS